jgi:hypothetical protein
MSGAFAKIAGASITGGGNNIRHGNYTFLIEKVEIDTKFGGEMFIAEFRVAEAEANGAVDEQGRPVVPNAVGSTCSLVCNLTKFENAKGNALAFLVGAMGGLGYTQAQVTPEVIGEVTSARNPLRGLAVRDETYAGVNKGRANPANAGKPLTLNKWKSIAQTAEAIAQQRAFLDGNSAKVEAAQPFAAPAPAVAAQPIVAQPVAAQPIAITPAPAAGGTALSSLLGLGK